MSQLMQRRDLLKLASATLVGLATGGLKGAMPRELVQNVAKDPNWSPVFFTAHQNETVVALTEIIIPKTDTPGANDAKVHRYLDLFLSVDTSATQTTFTDGLASLDRQANAAYQRDFVKCSASDQAALLNRMASANDPFFAQIKTLTASIYYATPEGYHELNKFGPPPANALACEAQPSRA